MITRKSRNVLLLTVVTLALSTGCSPDCSDCAKPQHNPGKAVASPWHTYKTGQFDPAHVFYSQFGTAPYDLASTTDLSDITPPVQSGVKIRFTVYNSDKTAVAFTAFMEKKPTGENALGSWAFSATDAEGKSIDVGNNCISCHKQQANNDYLFSLPVGKKQGTP